MIEKQSCPTDVLKSDISKFTEDIESLHTTLPLFMALTTDLTAQALKKLREYIHLHGEDVTDSGGRISYMLGREKVKESQQLEEAFTNYKNARRLIPRHFVISLVAQFDSFVGQLMRFIFEVKPEVLNASEKALTFTELMRFPDIASAKSYIIERDVEGLCRKSHADQFAWFKDKMKTSFNSDLQCWPTFIELTERRNLFVHTDGRVSSQYISVCEQHKVALASNISVGCQLEVPNEYYQEAYKCIYEIGVKMAHILWRRLCPDQLEDSDTEINELTLGLLEKNEHDLVIRILKHFTDKQFKHSSDIQRRTMLINLAQAYKWSEQHGECTATLASVDWDACEEKFKLAVATLQNNYEAAYRSMKRLKNDEEFHKANYREWPLFSKLRCEEAFLSTYEECYGEPFAVKETIEDEKPLEEEDGYELH